MKGEDERKDGRYQYRYTTYKGKRGYVYAETLQELREKEAQIEQDIRDGIDYDARDITILEMIDKWLEIKRGACKRSTICCYRTARNRRPWQTGRAKRRKSEGGHRRRDSRGPICPTDSWP